ncbi:sulfatase family protein [Flavobacterium sp.]|uniref:sulfatase family protein n=1 Tax=Flavobacterium sp. TaxID=239 RepID=UPI003C6509A1
MKFENIVLTALAVLSVGCQSQKKNVQSGTDKPNILIIFPDQLRRYSAGFWSEPEYKKHVIGKPDPVVTPNIDKLAKNGVVVTQGISNFPLCSPYRGMLMSGMYPEQNGIWNNCIKGRKENLKDDVQAITDLFYNAGYNTAYFGKTHWHITEPLFDTKGNYVGTDKEPGGHYVNTYDTYVPKGRARHGIEYFYQSVKDDHYNPHIYSNDPGAIEGKKDGELHLPKVFSPKNEASKIVDYLRNTRGQRDTKKPFCMMWALNPPHSPWDNDNTDMEAMHAFYDTDKFPKIDHSLVVRDNASLEVAKYARNYFANVTSTDKYMGQVLDELEKMGVLDNTIVIFSSDHGEMLGSHEDEGKNVIEMEAMAIPFIVHWPKGLKKGIADVLIGAPDVLPTVMGLAGLESKIPTEVQGLNLAELLINPTTTKIKKPESLLLMLSHSRGVLTDRYTLCVNENKKATKELGDTFIYDNLKDPYQFTKISLDKEPEVAKMLLSQLGQRLKQANDPWYKTKKFNDLILYPKN